MSSHNIRVLMADDSAVIRRLLSEALAPDKELEVVGVGRHGGEALQLSVAQRPDVILLDVEMPVMDGVEAVVAIRKLDAHIPIIMFSSITTRGGTATLDALSAGANDYVIKPVSLGHASEAMTYIRNELIPKIKLWGRRHRRRSTGMPSSLLAPTTPGFPRSPNMPPNITPTAGAAPPAMPKSLLAPTTPGFPRSPNMPPSITPTAGAAPPTMPGKPRDPACAIEIVAIGSSTGGPNALAEVLKRIPHGFPVPIVITQHMPPVFTQLLAQRLNSICPLNVREGVEGAILKPGDVWVAPGNFHMTVQMDQADRVLHLDQKPHENSCRPAVDPLFRSVATAYGGRCLGVVLTGMGRDGEMGSKAIRQVGGRIIAQDEESSVVWGMPRAVAQAGYAGQVLPLNQIAVEIVDMVRRTQVLAKDTNMQKPGLRPAMAR